MGQGHSATGVHKSKEQLTHELAQQFMRRCFTPLELLSFQDVFKSLADHQDSIAYLKEDTITRYLEIPDVLGVSPVLFQMLSCLAAFPFLQDAPAVLGFEQMVMVVVLLTQRYQRVLRKGQRDRLKLLFRSLAVFDRRGGGAIADGIDVGKPSTKDATDTVEGSLDDESEDGNDDLSLAALESLDAIEVFKLGQVPLQESRIPPDNFRKLIMLLLVTASLMEQQSISQLISPRLSADPSEKPSSHEIDVDELGNAADSVLAAFLNTERSPGITFSRFITVATSSVPYLFNGLNPLFSRFLFSRSLDFSKTQDQVPDQHSILFPPALASTGNIMTPTLLSQLSTFLKPSSLFGRLHSLYAGSKHGFSLRSFETCVFHWRSPTILLVRGTLLAPYDHKTTGSEAAFHESLPPTRLRSSAPPSTTVTFGVYVPEAWRQSSKIAFGTSDAKLFELRPVHEVFAASVTNTDYITFTSSSSSSHNSSRPAISIGCPIAKTSTSAASTPVVLGAVSLHLDSSFEYGVFTHDYSSSGGAFRTSTTRRNDWQDRFEIEEVEVWGLGGEDELRGQKDRQKWEEREAEARRRINLGTGDQEADRALLELVGLVGDNAGHGGGRSGGSMA